MKSNTMIERIAPTATDMIRADHTHVMTTFRQFDAETSPRRREAIVEAVCLALEVHAQLEEEIFYPALRAVAPDTPALERSVPEHAEVRRLVARLRQLGADDPSYEPTFLELMRDVMHHVADEETILLPLAAERLAGRLHELGARMARRRLQLSAPKVPALAWNRVQAMPMRGIWLAAGGVALAAYLFGRGARPAH